MMKNREWLDGFALRLNEALHRGASREERDQLTVEAAAEWVDATSAAYYECGVDGRVRRTAVAGLFPPLAPIAGAVLEKISTRARLFEHVLRSPEELSGESLVARVAASGCGELIADATADARVPRHADPALTVRSIICVPLLLREKVHGVLIAANAVSGGPFTSEDFSRAESLAVLAAAALLAPESAGARSL